MRRPPAPRCAPRRAAPARHLPRRHAARALVLGMVATLVLAGCPQDKGTPRQSGSSTTRPPATTAPPRAPSQPRPGEEAQLPEDLPRAVLLGGAKLTSVELASGTATELPNPRLENGLRVEGLLDRAFGTMVLVRGPLPQDAGAVYVLNDSEHLPRQVGTGVRAVAGGTVGEAWVAAASTPEAVTEVRRIDLGKEAPPLSQTLLPGRVLVGFGAEALVTGPRERSGSIDLRDPVKGDPVRSLVTNGVFLGADGQRAVVLADAACPERCNVLVAGPAGDRTWPLPVGLKPEPSAAAVASAAVLFVARQDGAPRRLWVLDLTSGEVKDTQVNMPPEAGPPPMATDAQGRWAFTRLGPSQLVGVRLATAEAITFPFELEPWGAIAVTAGGVCNCGGGGGGGGGGPTV